MKTGIQLLHEVASALKELREDVVFVGGATLSLYVDPVARPEARTTLDVDCVVELTSNSARIKLETSLERFGFRHDTSDGAPLCRWIVGDIPVNVMPTDEKVLGFSNVWYGPGIANARRTVLDSGVGIRIFSPAFFLASKIQALLNRGILDLRTSRDFEDVVFVVANNSLLLDQMRTDDREATAFVSTQIADLLRAQDIHEAIAAHVPTGGSSHSVDRITTQLIALSALPAGSPHG